MESNLKYFDPRYFVRSVKANPFDAVYCLRLAQHRAGRTEVVVSRWQGRFVLLPIPLAVRDRYSVDPNGDVRVMIDLAPGEQDHRR